MSTIGRPQKKVTSVTFLFLMIFIVKETMGKDIILTERQLEKLVNVIKKDKLNENNQDGSSIVKQQLFTIALMAYKMWEEMDDDETLEDWMSSKITQAEQSVQSVVKSYLYDDFVNDGNKGMGVLNYDEIVIGK
jgi:hypothetical protein